MSFQAIQYCKRELPSPAILPSKPPLCPVHCPSPVELPSIASILASPTVALLPVATFPLLLPVNSGAIHIHQKLGIPSVAATVDVAEAEILVSSSAAASEP